MALAYEVGGGQLVLVVVVALLDLGVLGLQLLCLLRHVERHVHVVDGRAKAVLFKEGARDIVVGGGVAQDHPHALLQHQRRHAVVQLRRNAPSAVQRVDGYPVHVSFWGERGSLVCEWASRVPVTPRVALLDLVAKDETDQLLVGRLGHKALVVVAREGVDDLVLVPQSASSAIANQYVPHQSPSLLVPIEVGKLGREHALAQVEARGAVPELHGPDGVLEVLHRGLAVQRLLAAAAVAACPVPPAFPRGRRGR